MSFESVAKVIQSLIIAALLCWVAVCVLIYLFQDKLLFQPSRGPVTIDAVPGAAVQKVVIKTASGLDLKAWHLINRNSPGTVLFFHGNGGHAGHWQPYTQRFLDYGYSVLLVDYRGYGENGGRPSEVGLYEDAIACWDFLREKRGVAGEHIVLVGKSLGGAVAAYLATRVNPGALILDSTFTRLPDLVKHLYPWWIPSQLCRYQFSTLDYIKEKQCPLLVIHSPDDEMIPYQMGRRLAELKTTHRFIERQGGHNDEGLNAKMRIAEKAFIRQALGF